MKRRETLKWAGAALATGSLGLVGCGGSSDAPTVTVAGSNAAQTVSAATAAQAKQTIAAMAGTTGIDFALPSTLAADSVKNAAGAAVTTAVPAPASVKITATTSTDPAAIGDFSFVDAKGNTVKGYLKAGSMVFVVTSVTSPTGTTTTVSAYENGMQITYNSVQIVFPTTSVVAGQVTQVAPQIVITTAANQIVVVPASVKVNVTVSATGAVTVNTTIIPASVTVTNKTTGAA